MVKDKKKHNGGAPKKKYVVGKNAARDDASIEQMQKDTAAAAGLGEETEADNGTAGEKSTSLAASPPSAAPGEDENETDALATLLAALLAAQAAPAEQPAAEPQVEVDQAEAMDGAEGAAPAEGPVRLTEQEQIDLRNSAYGADADRHAAEAERVKQMEKDDQMDYEARIIR